MCQKRKVDGTRGAGATRTGVVAEAMRGGGDCTVTTVAAVATVATVEVALYQPKTSALIFDLWIFDQQCHASH